MSALGVTSPSLARPHPSGEAQHGDPFHPSSLLAAVERFRSPVDIIQDGAARLGVCVAGQEPPPGCVRVGQAPAVAPERLGDRTFCQAHGTRFPYAIGAMANLLTSSDMVIAAGRAGFLAFLGTAGVALDRIADCIERIAPELGDRPWGCNLIHSPSEPGREMGLVELLLRRGVRRVCASAFTEVTPAAVRYAVTGMSTDPEGRVLRANHLFAKVSRQEVAAPFCRPAPQAIVEDLVRQRLLTAAEAEAARRVPLAGDVTVEGDSGGHTDNQNTLAVVPVVALHALRAARHHGCDVPARVGAAGGLGTPAAVAAAFAAGAAYVLTGSVNQPTRESPLSEHAKKLLASASTHDVTMAPSADMFEAGARVQVLKRGTLFAGRARRLHETYTQYESLEAIPPAVRTKLERDVLGATFDEIWATTRAFFLERDPGQIARAQSDPKHKMALVFRWYLGMASKWAIQGSPDRAMDYQIWCGPALGTFNAWVEGSFLAPLERRGVAEIGLNLLEGAATLTRAHQLRVFGLPVPPQAFEYVPRPLTGHAEEANHVRA